MLTGFRRFFAVPFGSSVLSSLLPVGVVILLALVLIGYIWTDSEYKHMQEDKQRYADDFVLAQKDLLRSEVVRIKHYLLRQKKQAEKDLEATLKSRVYDAYAVAQAIHARYHGEIPDLEVKKMIANALREMRFNEGRGYFFMTSLEGIEYLYPPNPSFEGRPITEIFPPKIQQLQYEMVDVVNAAGEGFVRYNWYRPGEKELLRKYSFVKLFEPYGLIIGTGDYLENFEALIKDRIFRDIAQVTFGLKGEGYFFINSYSGDLYVTNGKYFAGKKNIWDVTDAKGVKVVQENARLAQDYPEGAFSTYTWKKEGVEAEKISFIIGMDEWQIFIGAGAYLDTIEGVIQERENQYLELMKQRAISTIIIMLLALLIIVFVLYVIGLRLSQNLLLFQRNLEESVDSWTKLDTRHLHFKEFKHLASSVNSMIDGLNMQAEELRHRAFHDHLTSLPNRMHSSTQLDLMISHTIKHQATAALLFIDLDHFKEINDTLGHSTGDELLRKVSQRLRRSVREEDIVARLGGDEFTVITGVLETRSDAESIAQKLLNELIRPYLIDGNELSVTASIGVSFFPEDGDNSEILLRNADSAMYEAKRNGRNGYRLYTSAMTEEISERFALTEELREAISREELELYFQPQVDIRTGSILGAEALLRWNHPQRGMIPPDRFIPIAESSGQMIKIGAWVLEQVCAKVAGWKERGIVAPKIAVNISNQQMNRELVEQITELLASSKCDPACLELEITESCLMENPEQMAHELSSLKALGVGIAIDDFGTGYSSLSYLKQLPINKLKVDRSFVSDLQDDENDLAITRAIVAMGQSMNLNVIAEGIETQEQIDLLLKLECFEGQGYFYSKPLPEEQFLAYLDQ
ncbi:EAL domain-containing protein [Neptuniibacter caesariensis]|uniref:cyclic-guanylate-specific phosphodiesterase n=1 Tax=Neptuniibacter caesariensis TaxID=207954 RepID=A0A7U8C684_NEPCE|nr:EAL domain-containing protein [Neptuniibacter caesariensis]EAR62343.1 sensory box/GGDEF family protein [Oceanospirillum sp. MED92] [Neptuniibacter caesariensis]